MIKLNLGHISALELQCSKRSCEGEMKDCIESTYDSVEENQECDGISKYLFTIPFWTMDNSLQDSLPGMHDRSIQDATGENVVRTKSSLLKEFNKENIVCNKDSILNLICCYHINSNCVVDLCVRNGE